MEIQLLCHQLLRCTKFYRRTRLRPLTVGRFVVPDPIAKPTPGCCGVPNMSLEGACGLLKGVGVPGRLAKPMIRKIE